MGRKKLNADSVKTVAESSGDQTTKVFEDSKGLSNRCIYSRKELEAEGYTFAFLSINRVIDKNALKKKKLSIVENGIISPSLVVTATVCIKSGLDVVDAQGTPITADGKTDLDKILVVVDGQHRDKAIQELKTEKPIDNDKIENFYHFPLQNFQNDVSALLRESNVATKPWSGRDFVISILAAAPEGTDLSMLEWVRERFEDCGDTAAWSWATLNQDRIYTRSKLIKAYKDPELLKEVADIGNFGYGKELYDKNVEVFGKELCKYREVPRFYINKIGELTESKNKPDAVKELISFLDFVKKYHPEEERKSVRKLKKDDKESKDIKIKNKLSEFFNEYQKSKK